MLTKKNRTLTNNKKMYEGFFVILNSGDGYSFLAKSKTLKGVNNCTIVNNLYYIHSLRTVRPLSEWL